MSKYTSADNGYNYLYIKKKTLVNVKKLNNKKTNI